MAAPAQRMPVTSRERCRLRGYCGDAAAGLVGGIRAQASGGHHGSFDQDVDLLADGPRIGVWQATSDSCGTKSCAPATLRPRAGTSRDPARRARPRRWRRRSRGTPACRRFAVSCRTPRADVPANLTGEGQSTRRTRSAPCAAVPRAPSGRQPQGGLASSGPHPAGTGPWRQGQMSDRPTEGWSGHQRGDRRQAMTDLIGRSYALDT